MAKKVHKSVTTCLAETIQILDDLSGRQQMERILHQITQNLYEMTDCQTCAIIRLQPGYERLEIVNSQGLSWQFCKNYRRDAVHPEVRELLWHENPMSISDARNDDPAAKAFQLEHDFKSCYCVPLMTNKQPAGYLHLDSAESDHFSPDDQLLAQMYAKIISVAMLKSNLLSSLEKRSERDTETGAIIYDIFLRRLEESVAKAKRQGENLALILIDVVKFDNLLKLYGVATCKQHM
jgi:transcriptional regulator with GAF, ATPase, and Fis domain